ncbi:PIN domain-containing protein [Geminocystis herdmanii]|uniref:PIN domain-containing protein n=1 Tax=Geminocystis herdmanii TaxID=669359 RepID=UPI0003487A8E|nr:PIN domain-containing protein [Geminocystis herdmanii]
MFEFKRIFLDTNIYIIGDADKKSPESIILEAFGYRNKCKILKGEIILSDILLDQIRRVGKYLYGKDQAGEIISNIWRWLDIYYLPSTINWQQEKVFLEKENLIPREDIEIYLTAKIAKADCFISGNRKLLKSIADFDCLTSEDFIQKYLNKVI